MMGGVDGDCVGIQTPLRNMGEFVYGDMLTFMCFDICGPTYANIHGMVHLSKLCASE